MKVRIVKLRYWFLISGGVGLLVALTLHITTVTRHRLLSSELLYALWPASIIGFGDPTELSDKIFCGIFEFGGNSCYTESEEHWLACCLDWFGLRKVKKGPQNKREWQQPSFWLSAVYGRCGLCWDLCR